MSFVRRLLFEILFQFLVKLTRARVTGFYIPWLRHIQITPLTYKAMAINKLQLAVFVYLAKNQRIYLELAN